MSKRNVLKCQIHGIEIKCRLNNRSFKELLRASMYVAEMQQNQQASAMHQHDLCAGSPMGTIPEKLNEAVAELDLFFTDLKIWKKRKAAYEKAHAEWESRKVAGKSLKGDEEPTFDEPEPKPPFTFEAFKA